MRKFPPISDGSTLPLARLGHDATALITRALTRRAESGRASDSLYFARLALSVAALRDKGTDVKTILSSRSFDGQQVPRGFLARLLAAERTRLANQSRVEEKPDRLAEAIRAIAR